MSGGSFNYLYIVDPLDLPQRMEDLGAMQKTLAGLGYADDVAEATQAVIDKIKEVTAKFNEGRHPWEDGLEAARCKRADLEDITDRDADDEAAYQQLQRDLDAAERAIGELSSPLYWIWKGVEWWHSCDDSEETFKETLAQWRKPATRETTNGGVE